MAADEVSPHWAVIDWTRPWLAPWRATGEPVAAAVRAGRPSWQALNEAADAPVRFVAQSELPAGTAYERFIAGSGQCPTREGLHDFFNGLCWIEFPRSKRRLNRLQDACIAADGVGPQRGSLRDALTVFDENGALLFAPDLLWDALCAKEWRRLFGSLRPLWSDARLLLWGHALLEKLQQPRKAITAHVMRLPEPLERHADIDAWLERRIDPAHMAAKPFVHLPVLGVPGWWPGNDDPAFYGDPAVFRAPRDRRAAQ